VPLTLNTIKTELEVAINYLQAPRMYLTTQSQVLVLSLGEVNCAQRAKYLSNNVISGIAVKTQYHEMQRDALYR
jgi:hypothetical protein